MLAHCQNAKWHTVLRLIVEGKFNPIEITTVENSNSKATILEIEWRWEHYSSEHEVIDTHCDFNDAQLKFL